MPDFDLEKNLGELIDSFEIKRTKKYKLVAVLGLLGDFDSFEYAMNLKKLIYSKEFDEILDIYAVGIGTKKGKEKFCSYTGLPKKNIKNLPDNKIHNGLGISKGLDCGLGGWVNMLLMLSGFNSTGTIKEVIRGYTGDKRALQIYSDKEQINLLNIFKFSGNLFKRNCGSGYLRPFELATFRLANMIEIIKNWDDYILKNDYLPQRGATFILDREDNIIYKYYANEILSYSKDMSMPLDFIYKTVR